MRLSVLSTAAAERAGVLCCILFMVISAQALAQTSATDNPGPTAAQPSVAEQEKPAAATEEKPPAADDKPAIVEQTSAIPDAKPAVLEQKKPAVAQKKPALKQKSAARQPESAVRSKAAEHSKLEQPAKPVQPARAAAKPRERTLVMLCTRFRTYNPSSGTYRGYDGQTRSCR